MKVENLKLYRCPSCRSDQLALSSAQQIDDGWIEEGAIECGKCPAKFLITRGLPRFVPEANYADSFGFQWNIHRKTQLDSYSGLPISRNRVFGVTSWDADLRGERILEAGSGAGRFTEILVKTGADVISFDYSVAVDANYKNNGSNRNLNLFQGDIFNIPLEPASFEKVFCFGVLQHTPDPAAAFASLSTYVRPGGQLAIDVYRRDFFGWLQWKYLLRPVTKHMKKPTLYGLIEYVTPALIHVSKVLRKIAGRAGARFVPIVEFDHLGLSPELNRQWAILDTFDMYSPAHDHPQSLTDVRCWFESAGFVEIDVRKGPNGVVGMGRRPG
jgi:SAM-dependent methyltransferase